LNHPAFSGAGAANRRPFVLKANIAAAELVFLPNERHECEALHFGRPIGEIDGYDADWQLCSERWKNTPRPPSTRPLPMPLPRALQLPGARPIWLTDDRPEFEPL
jgi:hypothetical protein